MPAPSLAAVPRAPRTPSARAHQLIFTYQGKQKVLAIVGIIFMLVGFVQGTVLCWGLPVDLAIGATGRPAHGRVISTEINFHVRVERRHPTIVRFSYNFDGRFYEAQSTGTSVELRALRADDPVALEVAPFHPRWARVAGTTHSWAGYAGALGLPFPAIGAGIFLFARRSRRRAIQAFTHGTPVLAQVTAARLDMKFNVNGRHPFVVAWQFCDRDGHLRTGSLSSMNAQALEPLASAGQVVVLHDPADPRINTLFIA